MTSCVLEEVAFDASHTHSESIIEVETFTRNGETIESNSVLSLRAIHYNRRASAVSVEFVEIAGASKAFSIRRVKRAAKSRGVDASIVHFPLVGGTGYILTQTVAVFKNKSIWVAAIEAASSKGIEGSTSLTHIQARAIAEVLSWRASRIGEAGSIDQRVFTQTFGTNSEGFIEVDTREPGTSNIHSPTSLKDLILVRIRRRERTCIRISLPF